MSTSTSIQPLCCHPGLDRLLTRFDAVRDPWGNYTWDFTLEGLMRLDERRGGDAGLQRVLEFKHRRGEGPEARIPYTARPFGCLEWELGKRTGDVRYLRAVARETLASLNGFPRDKQGRVLHRDEGGRLTLLVDRLQEVATRWIRAGVWLDNPELVREGVRQWRLQAEALCDPATGLWWQGTGWLPDGVHSPGFWSRGQGWVLRGLVLSAAALKEAERHRGPVDSLLNRLVTGLVNTQAPDGSWHRLLNRPPEASLPDSSGTGMIFAFGMQALTEGLLDDPGPFRAALGRAEAYLAGVLSEEGDVADGCPGPGPLESEAPYLGDAKPSPLNEPHAVFAWLLSAAAPSDQY